VLARHYLLQIVVPVVSGFFDKAVGGIGPQVAAA
jgi:hypothetical protein